jgi:hypothetical protein
MASNLAMSVEQTLLLRRKLLLFPLLRLRCNCYVVQANRMDCV